MKNAKQDFKIVYYSHCKLTYGTAEEIEVKQYIMEAFDCCLICPNENMSKNGFGDRYAKVVSKVDLVVFSEYNGHVSSGVYSDIKTAIELQIPVYALRKNDTGEFYLHKLVSIELLTERTNFRYATAKVKKSHVALEKRAVKSNQPCKLMLD